MSAAQLLVIDYVKHLPDGVIMTGFTFGAYISEQGMCTVLRPSGSLITWYGGVLEDVDVGRLISVIKRDGRLSVQQIMPPPPQPPPVYYPSE